MGPVTATIAIDVPRERAFEFLSDLANRPAILGPFALEYRLERLESAGEGAAARYRISGDGLWVETVITDLEPPHRIVERGHGGRLDRLPVNTAWELIEAPGGEGCEVSVMFWTEPKHPADRMRDLRLGATRWYRRSWFGVLGRLKQILETELVTERVAVAGGERVPGAG